MKSSNLPDQVSYGSASGEVSSGHEQIAPPPSVHEGTYLPGLVIPTKVTIRDNNEYALTIARDVHTSDRAINGIPVISAGIFENACMRAYYGNTAKIGPGRGWSRDKYDFDTYARATEILPAAITRHAYNAWQSMGSPAEFQLIEMGAGTGDLALKSLAWAERFDPAFAAALQYTIVEQSGHLIQNQQHRLGELRHGVTWYHGSALDLPPELSQVRGMFISNELIDEFTPETVTRSGTGALLQKFVGIQNNAWVEVWQTADKRIAEYVTKYNVPVEPGWQYAVLPDSAQFMHQVADRIEQGGVLTVDYGSIGYAAGYKDRGKSPIIVIQGGLKLSNTQRFAEYEAIGYRDVSVNVSGAPLRMAAEEAGLHTTFSGLQSELIQQANVSDIIDSIQKLGETSLLEEKRYWKSQLAFANQLSNVEKGNSVHHFFGHIATRNMHIAL